MLFMVLSRSYSLYSGYFIPLCLCDLSIRCFRIHSLCTFAITQSSSCLSWGSVQGVSWESFLSLLVLFIFYILSPFIFVISMFLSHTAFLFGAYSVCVHRDSVFCVCTLFFLHPIRLEGSIFGGPYIFGGLYLFGGLFARLRPGSS
jgi:hypothetical protein